MKLQLESTDTIQEIDGVPHRIWAGVTDSGVPVKAAVRFVQPQTHDARQLAAFERELQELPKPRSSVVITDLRFIA